MSVRSRLLRQYSGSRAEAYDRTRTSTPRFLAEDAAFERLVSSLGPQRVLDCPVGTGRWLNRLADSGCAVVGLDASEDMLRQARAKATALSVDAEFIPCDLLQEPLELPDVGRIDLVLCIRFLNWVNAQQLERIIGALARLEAQHFIFGISLRRPAAGMIEKVRYRVVRAAELIRAVTRGAARPRVHSQNQFEDALARAGLAPGTVEHIFSDTLRDNYFVLCRKGSDIPRTLPL